MKYSNTGFSLIELMIVVAIIGILSAVAVPVYTNYIESSEYSTASSHLDSLILFEETYKLNNDKYLAGEMIGNDPGSALYSDLGLKPGQSGEGFTYKVTACSGGDITECYTAEVFHTDKPSVKVSYTKEP